MNDAKRAYTAPKLQDWGKVVDLTQVDGCISTDSFLSGSVLECKPYQTPS